MKNNYQIPDSGEQREYIKSLFKKAWRLNPLFDWRMYCALIDLESPHVFLADMFTTFIDPYINFFTGDYRASISGFKNLFDIFGDKIRPITDRDKKDENYSNAIKHTVNNFAVNSKWNTFIALSYAKLNQIDSALIHIDKNIKAFRKIDKEYSAGILLGISEIYFLKAYLYELKGEYEKAIEYYQKSYLKGALDYLVLYRISCVYHNIGNIRKEQEELEHAIMKSHDEGICNYNLGFLYMRKGMREKAEEQYLKAVNLNPEFPKPYYNLGLIYENKGNTSKAIKFYKKFIDRASSNYSNQIETARLKIQRLSY